MNCEAKALNDHEIALLINELRDVAITYTGCDSLRGAIAKTVLNHIKPHTEGYPRRTKMYGTYLSRNPLKYAVAIIIDEYGELVYTQCCQNETVAEGVLQQFMASGILTMGREYPKGYSYKFVKIAERAVFEDLIALLKAHKEIKYKGFLE